jgi:hypothetical protein
VIGSSFIGTHQHSVDDLSGGGPLGIALGGTNATGFTTGDLVYYNAGQLQSIGFGVGDIARLDDVTEQVFVGNLQIDKSSPVFQLDRDAITEYSWVEWRNIGVLRWRLGMVNDANGDFGLWRYNDAGTYQDLPLRIYRSTGNVYFANAITAGEWQGTPIASAFIGTHTHSVDDLSGGGPLPINLGGTNATGFSAGDVIYYQGGLFQGWTSYQNIARLDEVETFSAAKTFTAQVTGNSTTHAFIGGSAGGYRCDVVGTAGGWARGFSFYDTGGSTRDSEFGLYGVGSDSQLLYAAFGTSPWSSGTGLYVHDTGNVSIKTVTENGALNVNGSVYITGSILSGAWGAGVIGWAYGGRGDYSFIAGDERFEPWTDKVFIPATNVATTWTANLSVDGAQARVQMHDDSTHGASWTVDWEAGNIQKFAVSATQTITIDSAVSSIPLEGAEYHLIIRATNSCTVTISGCDTWFTSLHSEPDFAMTAGDVLHLFFTCVSSIGSILMHGWASDLVAGAIN